MEAAAGEMAEVQKSGASLLAAPEGCGSWKEWAAGVQAAAAGELEQGGEATAAAVRSLLQARLVQLEAALLAESVGGLAADGDSSGECCHSLTPAGGVGVHVCFQPAGPESV